MISTCFYLLPILTILASTLWHSSFNEASFQWIILPTSRVSEFQFTGLNYNSLVIQKAANSAFYICLICVCMCRLHRHYLIYGFWPLSFWSSDNLPYFISPLTYAYVLLHSFMISILGEGISLKKGYLNVLPEGPVYACWTFNFIKLSYSANLVFIGVCSKEGVPQGFLCATLSYYNIKQGSTVFH